MKFQSFCIPIRKIRHHLQYAHENKEERAGQGIGLRSMLLYAVSQWLMVASRH